MAGNNGDVSEILTSQEIRLLKIYPSENDTDVLECRRIRVNLTDTGPYEALSYVWGDAMDRADISCDGMAVSVTVNLFNALNKLRLPDKPRIVWVDAICINQASIAEKNCQVPLMGGIYSGADKVVVWLGETGLAQSMKASETVKIIADECRAMRRGVGSNALEESASWEKPSSIELDPPAEESLNSLFATTWFTRVWCIQEITLAKYAIVLWGESTLLWTDIRLTVTWLHYRAPVRALDFDESASYARIESSNAYLLADIKRASHDLPTLVDQCKSFNATNPRDRVYGLLSLLDSAEEANTVSVDYGKALGDVFGDVILATIRLYSDLYALAFVEHGSEYFMELGFASWTPRWYPEGGPRHLLAEGSDLRACGETSVRKLDISFLNSQHLCLFGLLYSEVVHVHDEMDLDDLNSFLPHPFLEVLAAVPDSYESRRTLARTLTAGCDGEQNDIVFAETNKQDAFYASFDRFIASTSGRITVDEDDGSMADQNSFFSEAETVCVKRRIFHTRKGTFGLGPACMRRGDIVVVLFGGQTPCILRPFGYDYLFMGQAYVDELMQGELVADMETGIIQEQEFCLI